ncbi:cGMP-dependent protein kinase, isozyme 1 [Halotydeus destructor]|nr:cGMP-dependent protein kinase, isozyme 1 [Halotydeus destructor]
MTSGASDVELFNKGTRKGRKSLTSRLTASSLLSPTPRIDVVVTPPASVPAEATTSFFGSPNVQSNMFTFTSSASSNSSPKSRLGLFRQSVRLFRSSWKKKKRGNRKRSKSVGEENSAEELSNILTSKCPSDAIVELRKRSSRSDHLIVEETKIYPTPETVSLNDEVNCSRSSQLNLLTKVRRKRSKSLECQELRKQLTALKRATRKRSRSLSSVLASKDNLNIPQISPSDHSSSSRLSPFSPEEKRNVLILVSPGFDKGSLGSRRISKSLNDICHLDEIQLAGKRKLIRQQSEKQKQSSFLRRTLSRLSKRKRKSNSSRPCESASGSTTSVTLNELPSNWFKHHRDKMGQNLTASSTGSEQMSHNLLSPETKNVKHHDDQERKAKFSRESNSSKKSKDDKRDIIGRLREELLLTKRQLFEKEQQLFKQHREIHKLKSVLDQHQKRNEDSSNSPPKSTAGRKSNSHSAAPIKKCGVSGQSLSTVAIINKVEKDFRSRQLIKEALVDNSFLQNFLDSHQLRLIIDAMFEKEYTKGSLLCEQGTIGSHLFVIAYGHCQIITDGEPVNSIGPGKAFGELAILYNCTRTASVKALTKVRVWVLDRKLFQAIMMKTGKDRRNQYKIFLKSVPLLQNLSDEMIAKIVDSIEVDIFPAGDYICRQGCHGDSFYIISNGTVRVTQEVLLDSTDEAEDKLIRILNKGDYFGEQALLTGGSLRTANVVSNDCECLILDRSSFHSLFGDLNELRSKQYHDEIAVSAIAKVPSELDIEDASLRDIKLDDLDVVATLGVGGFGRVDLVQCVWDESRVFALKSCSKAFIRSTQQEQHIKNERQVQKQASKHQFVTKLYRTFKDNNFVYFLMEASLGGELWTLLRNRGSFDEMASRFYIGCVVEALQYLHSQHIVYRDLKPENCLLDSQGYLKLTDFGFSKILRPGEKTWTFCGTPEYVAPEIILNKGHDQAVDFWSIGILLYELLTGLPPFQSTDPLKTYNIILRGFDAIGFDERVFSKHAVNLIRRLCRENHSERIGVQKNGYLDLKRHKWFFGFDWNALVKRTMKPPIVPKLGGPTDAHYFDISPLDMSMRTDFDQENTEEDVEVMTDLDWDKDF